MRHYFYPRSPCGERRKLQVRQGPAKIISIHALLAESDDCSQVWQEAPTIISIHALLAESDAYTESDPPKITISIHALLAESDKGAQQPQATRWDFYPRSPCGERRWCQGQKCPAGHFYPRSPCGERLHYDNYNLHCVEISIHALLAESDCRTKTIAAKVSNFYPRSPCGERHCFSIFNRLKVTISIHALLAESDVYFL